MATAAKVIWLDRGYQPAFLGYVPNKRAWDKEMASRGLKGEAYPRHAATTSAFRSDRAYVILVSVNEARRKGRSRLELMGLLAHEATHVKQLMFKEMGVKKPDMETEAYTVQAIFQQLVTAFARSRK